MKIKIHLLLSKIDLWLERWPLKWQIKNFILWLLVRYRPNFLNKEANLKLLNKAQKERLYLYYKHPQKFSANKSAISARELKISEHSYYCGDILNAIYPYYIDRKFHKEFGDVTWVPNVPTFVKSRPICDENNNSILLPLDVRRHMQFPIDPYAFEEKKSSMVWRGAGYQTHRQVFLKKANVLDFCDAGDPGLPELDSYYKPRLSIHEQLRFKYIISIEGNDVATNLKWIMHSNSLCIMPKPKFETWFLESRLVSGLHYAEVREDFEDLEEVFSYFEANPNEAKEIIKNAQAYTQQFLNRDAEKLISQHVCHLYFENCVNKS